MAKFYGEIGYGETRETPSGSGVYVDEMTEIAYYGDVIRNSRRLDSSDKLNDDIVVSNSISVLADEYAFEHFFAIRYIRWAGTLWTVTNVEVKSPRLILTLGNVYNGPVFVPYTNAIEIIDNLDGTWTAVGADDRIIMTDETTFQIVNVDGSFADEFTYTISSTRN